MLQGQTLSWHQPITCHNDSSPHTHSLLTAQQAAWGFNWESEQVLAVHQIRGLDGYFEWSDMNSRGSPMWLCCAY